jgi:hypothetical protein
VSFKASTSKGNGADPLRSLPCDASHDDGPHDGASAAVDGPTATPHEARAIKNLERLLQSVKAVSRSSKKPGGDSQSKASRRFDPVARRSVAEPITTSRKAPPTTGSRGETTLPPDGWVRIVSDLNICASNVEMWLRIDRYSGYIKEFRIGSRPTKS